MSEEHLQTLAETLGEAGMRDPEAFVRGAAWSAALSARQSRRVYAAQQRALGREVDEEDGLGSFETGLVTIYGSDRTVTVDLETGGVTFEDRLQTPVGLKTS